jgi:translation initiation factor 1
MKNNQTNTGMSGLNSLGGLVYSTDAGRMCPDCHQSLISCDCKGQAKAQQLTKTDGVVRVSLQTKGRGGKSVTLVKGLPLDALALGVLAKQLRAACGSGGTVKDGVVEVQGDHVVTVMTALQKHNNIVKRAGG